MSRYIPENIRLEVATRANFKCEYCLVHEVDMFFTYQVDHIISIKHGGENNLNNLAYACSVCNQLKGTDLGTYLPDSNRLVRLFNPRRDKWAQHFSIGSGEILFKTRIGEATIKVLGLNLPERIILRQVLIQTVRYLSGRQTFGNISASLKSQTKKRTSKFYRLTSKVLQNAATYSINHLFSYDCFSFCPIKITQRILPAPARRELHAPLHARGLL